MLQIMRIKNYIKNFLIFIPFIFSAQFLEFNKNEYLTLFIGFMVFSFSSSIIYIINDICDIEKDKLDEVKKYRPLPSGKVSIKQAICLMIILVMLVLCGCCFLNIKSMCIVFLYVLLNCLYSFKLKNIPILDITLLSIFFLIRIFYGGILLNIYVSNYLYLTVLAVSYYFGIGKRIKELEQNKEVRDVLKKYPQEYLKEMSNLFLGVSIIFYSLWVINYNGFLNIFFLEISIFLVILILIYYHYLLHKAKNGNPTDMLLSNKTLIFLVLIYCVVIFFSFI